MLKLCWKNLLNNIFDNIKNYVKTRWLRSLILLIIVVIAGVFYWLWIGYYDVNSLLAESDTFYLTIQRHGGEAKDCIAFLNDPYTNDFALNTYIYQVTGKIWFNLTCQPENDFPAFNVDVTGLQDISKNSGIFGPVTVGPSAKFYGSTRVNKTSYGAMRFYVNSSNMQKGGVYHLSFELDYEPKDFNKHDINIDGGPIGQLRFVYGKKFVCPANCFSIIDAKVTQENQLIPLPVNNEVYNSKQWTVSNSNAYLRFSPRIKKLVVWSEIIRALILGFAATALYSAFFMGNTFNKSKVYLIKKKTGNKRG